MLIFYRKARIKIDKWNDNKYAINLARLIACIYQNNCLHPFFRFTISLSYIISIGKFDLI